MLGFSLSKLLVLAAIIAAVWYGFRLVQRRQEMQRSADRDKVERRPATSSEELVACRRCGVYVPVEGQGSCGRARCPY